MRHLIAAMKISVDGKTEGPDGFADWVDAWSDDYGLMPQVDACLLGGRMYPGYEQYWTAIQNQPDQPLPMTGRLATPAEVQWARFAQHTPHHVLSSTLHTAAWPGTRFLRSLADVAALKQAPGRDIYLMGGAHIVASLTDAGLVDELRLNICPLLAGAGKALFGPAMSRRALRLQQATPLEGGRVLLTYAV